MARARLLIVCTGNSARSQIAQGLFWHEAGEWFEVFSAGTEPAHVRREAIQVMNEIGIDISQQDVEVRGCLHRPAL
jgi:arsenate reductase